MAIWVRLEKERGPHHQFALENSNPAWSALQLRFNKQLKKYFGEGVVVADAPMGAAAQGRHTDSGWRRRLWKLQILLDDVRSHCEACKAGILHSQAACPQKGDNREWDVIPGELKATKNGILVLLAAVIGRAMIMGRQRSEERAEKANRKRKR